MKTNEGKIIFRKGFFIENKHIIFPSIKLVILE